MQISQLTFILLFLSFTVTAQENLRNFSAEQIGSVIYLNWTLEKGFICTGTSIERSSNQGIFEQIGQIEGICGSFDEAIEFDFADSNPLPNQANYYRLRLGSRGYSDTLTILYIHFNESAYSLSPNPVWGESKLFFTNKSNEHVILKIFDQNGKFVLEKNGNSQSFMINKHEFKPGIHLFYLCYANMDCMTGSFIVF
ncbi:MAG: T9SS type A sorting domain-containing protein [Bacteroidetes bacterium]|nr:T9SS type A sorting domain-containing protein [Bacteroidota bacterium]MBL6963708.1 T9SS type A sorting domain-containing protein [Bacteroidota bacterium]